MKMLATGCASTVFLALVSHHAIGASASRLCRVLVLGAATGFCESDETEFFETRVRPVLANRCYSCHTSSKLGSFQLDHERLTYRYSGRDFRPTNVEGRERYHRVRNLTGGDLCTIDQE
jgi:hypothetical protein